MRNTSVLEVARQTPINQLDVVLEREIIQKIENDRRIKVERETEKHKQIQVNRLTKIPMTDKVMIYTQIIDEEIKSLQKLSNRLEHKQIKNLLKAICKEAELFRNQSDKYENRVMLCGLLVATERLVTGKLEYKTELPQFLATAQDLQLHESPRMRLIAKVAIVLGIGMMALGMAALEGMMMGGLGAVGFFQTSVVAYSTISTVLAGSFFGGASCCYGQEKLKAPLLGHSLSKLFTAKQITSIENNSAVPKLASI